MPTQKHTERLRNMERMLTAPDGLPIAHRVAQELLALQDRIAALEGLANLPTPESAEAPTLFAQRDYTREEAGELLGDVQRTARTLSLLVTSHSGSLPEHRLREFRAALVAGFAWLNAAKPPALEALIPSFSRASGPAEWVSAVRAEAPVVSVTTATLRELAGTLRALVEAGDALDSAILQAGPSLYNRLPEERLEALRAAVGTADGWLPAVGDANA